MCTSCRNECLMPQGGVASEAGAAAAVFGARRAKVAPIMADKTDLIDMVQMVTVKKRD